MKIKPYITKLGVSNEYKQFSKKHKDAFLTAGFFILDLETKKNIHQIDYYVPNEKKIAAFTLDGGVKLQMLDTMNSKAPEKLDIRTNIDLDALPGILEDEMKNRNITEEIKKIIAIIQNIDGKRVWNLSCILSGMGLLRSHVDDDSKTVLKMEKSNMMDIMKKVTPEDLAAMKSKAQQAKGPASKKDLEGQMQKLDQLGKDIEKEKDSIQKQLNDSLKGLKSSKQSKTKKN